MAKMYRSALGKPIDMDQLRLNNEDVIAVGNMKVNARGDELGPGGEVLRSRNEVMNEYYKLNTPSVGISQKKPVLESDVFLPPEQPASPTGLRGSLADSVARTDEE